MPRLPTKRFCRMDIPRTSLPSPQSQVADRLCADLGGRLGPQLLTRLVVDQPLPTSRVELDPDVLASIHHTHIKAPVINRNLPQAVHVPRHGALRQGAPRAPQAPRAGPRPPPRGTPAT